ncbi:hypothetical protein TNCV_1345871 [Trichonephila clavipes]|nr:hypothetical protein TNCV_1345871 [Trichonephila clavipes]
MYLGKQCLMQSAISKSLPIMIDVQKEWAKTHCKHYHKAIEKRVQRNPRVSMRQIARDIGISDRSVRRE